MSTVYDGPITLIEFATSLFTNQVLCLLELTEGGRGIFLMPHYVSCDQDCLWCVTILLLRSLPRPLFFAYSRIAP